LDLTSCHLLAAVADCLRLAGKELQADGVESSVGVALSRERIRLTGEILSWCADVSGFLAEGEVTEEERATLDHAVQVVIERARKAREFYANLLAWIEQGRKRPVPPLDELRRDGARRFSSAEVLHELRAGR
jgi:hypothetical protein